MTEQLFHIGHMTEQLIQTDHATELLIHIGYVVEQLFHIYPLIEQLLHWGQMRHDSHVENGCIQMLHCLEKNMKITFKRSII